MPSTEQIAAAAERLSAANLRQQINEAIKEHGNGAHRVSPVLWSRIADILTIADGGKLIMVSFNDMPEVEYKDYNPGDLPEHLCQRFRELPQFADATKNVREVVRWLGYADVVGIYLAGEAQKSVFSILEIDLKKRREFLEWVEIVLRELEITRDDPRIADFNQFASLTKIMHHTSVRDRFDLLNQSPVYLKEESLLSSDCERLVELGIKTTPDLAQTSVQILAKAFVNDPLALQRITCFLDKRRLGLGMKFLPQWK